MTEFYELIKNNSEACREEGKRLLFGGSSDEERKWGLTFLNRAVSLGDLEAWYIKGKTYLGGGITAADGSLFIEEGLYYLCVAANKGYVPARTLLNSYCNIRYAKSVGENFSLPPKTPLVDFDGKKIKLKRRGIMTPIDAELSFADGVNTLTLSANIAVLDTADEMEDYEKFKAAVLDGFKQWEGTYSVFGGQELKVVVELTEEDRLFDNVIVMPFSNQMNEYVVGVWNKIGNKKMKNKVNSLIGSKRSFAGIGLAKWSVKTRKIIAVQSRGGRFNEYEEIMHIAKHEFGHALGLGDLYKSSSDGLGGVDKGTYREIDCYHISDNLYNLVMCDHHGPISNNDIEMVVLAFSRNAFQNYQPSKLRGKISDALGRGN